KGCKDKVFRDICLHAMNLWKNFDGNANKNFNEEELETIVNEISESLIDD
ncbi:6395_t:CDS:2, partial [Racocetra fulgida]